MGEKDEIVIPATLLVSALARLKAAKRATRATRAKR
jgi:hypothetical protein